MEWRLFRFGGADDVPDVLARPPRTTFFLHACLRLNSSSSFILSHLIPLHVTMVNSLWFQWKSLKLPWRKSRIAGKLSTQATLDISTVLLTLAAHLGVDLAGNTFWEYRDDPNANRWRRMLKPDPKIHLSDVQVTRECYASGWDPIPGDSPGRSFDLGGFLEKQCH